MTAPSAPEPPPADAVTLDDVRAAARRLDGLIAGTPTESSPRLSELAGCGVVLKLENQHHTGSFKERGALNKLLAFNQLTGEPVTLDMAENAVKDLIRPTDPKRVRVDDILRVVAKHYNVSRADLLSQRRTATVVKPRQIAMYLAKTLTLRSLPEIGRRFGGRDHTTVLHAVRKIDGLVATDRVLADEIEVLKRLALES